MLRFGRLVEVLLVPLLCLVRFFVDLLIVVCSLDIRPSLRIFGDIPAVTLVGKAEGISIIVGPGGCRDKIRLKGVLPVERWTYEL